MKVGSGWCGPHLKVCAPITQCFDFFNRSYNTEPRNTEFMAKVGVGKIEGSPCMSRSCCRSGRGVPGMHAPDPYRSISSIFHSRCGSSYYTATSDSYSTFVTPTSHLNSMNGSWSKQPRFENTPYIRSRGKDKGTLASRLNQNSEWSYRGLAAYIL